MKRLLPLLFSLALLFPLAPRAFAAAPNGVLTAAVYNYTLDGYDEAQELPLVNLQLDDQPIFGEMPGVILGNRTLAPLRLLAEGLGAQVDWVPDAAQVWVTREDTAILLTLGSAVAEVNGVPQALPDEIPATMLSYEGRGYTMVPLRFFSETLDCQVDWLQDSYTATVTQRQRGAQALEPSSEPSETPAASSETPVEPSAEPSETPAEPSEFSGAGEGPLVVLDPGHGGSASGAYYEETAEKDLNLAITQKVAAMLRAQGCRVMLTRREDVYVDLYQRAWMANEAGAELFVSIHCNAAEKAPDFQGTYVYYHPDSEKGRALAQAIQDQVCALTGSIDRGTASANFVVLRETAMPAALVEAGFMTYHEELERLRDDAYQTAIAQGVAQGILQYLSAGDAPEEEGRGETPVPLDL